MGREVGGHTQTQGLELGRNVVRFVLPKSPPGEQKAWQGFQTRMSCSLVWLLSLCEVPLVGWR